MGQSTCRFDYMNDS